LRKPFLLLTVLAGILLHGGVLAASGSVDIETAIEPADIYQGESLTLTLRVSGFNDGMEPDLTSLPSSSVTFQGQTDQSFQNITIINGKRQVNSFSGRIFQYRVVPGRTGTFNLGPIRVTEAGKAIASVPGPSVTVRPIPQQDTALLFLEPSKTTVILDESFTVTLRILIRRLPPPFADASPLPGNDPPLLDIPYLAQTGDDGLERENTQQRLNAMLVSSGEAFRINSFSVGGDPFGGIFGQQQQARFRLDRQPVEYGGFPYFEYSFTLRYTPQREGIYHFDPVVFKGPVFVQVSPQGEGRTDLIYALTDAVTVEVAPPPAEGRPPTYIGAIGTNLTVSATLDTQTCFVGDPLTLTLEIAGNVRMENITAPRLGVQDSLSRDFRIYEDSVQRESEPDRRRYRFTVRPSRAGTLEFPPVTVSYYDTAASAYRSVCTEPIPVRANAVTEVQSDIIISTTERRVTIGTDGDEDSSRLPPAPLVMSRRPDAVESFFRPRLHIPLLLAGPLAFIAVTLLRLLHHLLPRLRRYQSRRSAAGLALHQIRQAGTAPDSASLRIAQALRGYLQTRGGDRVKAATPGECEQILKNTGIPDGLASRFARCLNACASAAFAGVTPDGTTPALEELRQEGESLVTAIEQIWKKQPRRQRRPGILLAVALLFLILPPSTRAGDPASGSDFETQRANTALLNASRPEDFAKAAEALAALIDQGAANAGLFFNYGTALLMAGDPAGAMEALARAERYSGSTWGIRRNMLLALRALHEDSPPALPWYRIPLFWHFRLPAEQRMTVTASAFLMAWLMALLLPTRRREAAIAGLCIAISVFLLFGASTVSSLYAEHHAAIAHAQRLHLPTAEPQEDSQ
jgi:hypothetical protein